LSYSTILDKFFLFKNLTEDKIKHTYVNLKIIMIIYFGLLNLIIRYTQ